MEAWPIRVLVEMGKMVCNSFLFCEFADYRADYITYLSFRLFWISSGSFKLVCW